MDGSGRQSRLLGRLLGKLRGEHRYSTLDKQFSFTSTGMSESIGCGSANEEEDAEPFMTDPTEATQEAASSATTIDDAQFAANIDLRYGGQYLTPEQLPEFCNQLHHLVEVIRNIQSYAKVTGEYPSELERRLEREAREVWSLAREAHNALEAAARARLQRRALRTQRAALARGREDEIRELESSVRVSDRKLYKSWEAVKDSTDPVSFEPLVEEVKGKQAALECMMRLIESKRASMSRPPAPRPLPPPRPPDARDEDALQAGSRKRAESRRCKRKRRDSREARSVPLSGENSRHAPHQLNLISTPTSAIAVPSGYVTLSPSHSFSQVTLYVQGAALGLEPPRASVRDILFFTTD